jgi:pyrroline-5-carboxylate reductase
MRFVHIALQGAARMALQPDAHPAQIKDSVASELERLIPRVSPPTHVFLSAPGGCTIAGLLTLEDGRVRSTIARAIQVATERAGELGQPATK